MTGVRAAMRLDRHGMQVPCQRGWRHAVTDIGWRYVVAALTVMATLMAIAKVEVTVRFVLHDGGELRDDDLPDLEGPPLAG